MNSKKEDRAKNESIAKEIREMQKEISPTALEATRNEPSKEKEKAHTKEEKKTSEKVSIAPKTVVEGAGINLIPSMTEDEIEKEEKKKKVSLSSLISLSLLFSISILVIGFNIISKIQLNTQKEKISEKERVIKEYSQLISGNTEILERIFLYKDIQDGRFSSKLVIDYIQGLLSKSGGSDIRDFSFSGNKSFEFSGNSQGLEDVAKLWYLLSHDSKIEGVELRSFSKTNDGATYSFSGDLKVEEFSSSPLNSVNQ